MITLPKLSETKLHMCRYRDVTIEIRHWTVEDFEDPDKWNFYVYLAERQCPRFSEIWLEDKLMQFSSASRPWISHDYMHGLTGSIEMHGGITFYEKHGYTDGHRCVKLGCDYCHLWDRGRQYSIEDILRDAMECVDGIYELGILSPEQPTP